MYYNFYFISKNKFIKNIKKALKTTINNSIIFILYFISILDFIIEKYTKKNL